MEEQPPDTIDVDKTELGFDPDPPAEATAELVDEPKRDPPPELIDALVAHFNAKRLDLERQIGNIEQFLGFVEVSTNLAARVARLEAFVGIKG